MFKKILFLFFLKYKIFNWFFFLIIWFLRGREESKNDVLFKFVNNIFFLE